MPDLDGDLNDEQRECLEHPGKALLVIAGPGSGKTRCLTAMIAKLISSGEAHPSQVLALTFTRLAAAEMRSRVIEAAGTKAAGATIGTFHSVCYGLVCNRWKELGFSSPEITIYDRQDQQALVKETIATSRHSVSQRAVLRAMDQIAQTGDDAAIEQDVKDVLALYRRALKDHNAVDYASVAPLALEAIRGVGGTGGFKPFWKFVFIDETQDCDLMQHVFLSSIGCDRIVAVADPDQLIYSWRSASIELMRSMPNRFGMAIKYLNTNYRSSQPVIDAANHLIAHNANRIKKSIVAAESVGGAGGEVRAIDDRDFEAAYRYAARRGSLAVLGRTHDVIGGYWQRARESAALSGGAEPELIGRRERLLERIAVRTALSYLCWPEFPNNPRIMQRVLAAENMSELRIAKVRAAARTDGITFFDAAKEIHQQLACWYDQTAPLPLLEAMMMTLARLKAAPTTGGGLVQAEEADLISIMTVFIRGEILKDRTPGKFAAWLNMRDGQDEVAADGDVPQFMTIHAAKGLEFDRIMIVGLDDKILPHKRANLAVDELEEERRLMFVAMTRARHDLMLVRPSAVCLTAGAKPSRFIEEAIPPLSRS